MAVPYQFAIFNYSAPFSKLFIDEGEDHFLLPANATSDYIRNALCNLIYDHIVEKFYGIKLNNNHDLVYPVVNKATGMTRYYKLRYDRRFIDIHLLGELPLIKDCAVCLNTFRIMDMDMQLKKMPLDLFAAEGFGVWIAEDFTIQESLDAIKKILLQHHDCNLSVIQSLKNSIHSLIGLNEVEVGLTPFIQLNGRFVMDENCTQHGILGKNWKASNPEDVAVYQKCVNFFSEHPEPIPL